MTESLTREQTRDRAVDALSAAELAGIVDLVVWVDDVDGERVAHAANHLGTVRLRTGGVHEVLAGTDPIASEDPMAFLPYRREVEGQGPRVSSDNAYPYAAERILSLFDDPTRSPDLAVVHTPRHYFPDEGGHHGEHGSLDVIQSRAPLVLVRHRGRPTRVPRRPRPPRRRRTDPGCPGRRPARRPASTRRGRRSTGGCSTHTSTRPSPRGRSSAFCGTVRTAATSCTWPRRGSCRRSPGWSSAGVALRGGAVAQFPSVTLTNHTSHPHRYRPRPARGPRERVLRPRDRRAGRAERRDDVAPVGRVAAARGAHGVRDGRGSR